MTKADDTLHDLPLAVFDHPFVSAMLSVGSAAQDTETYPVADIKRLNSRPRTLAVCLQPMLERERNFAVDEDVILQLTTQDHGTWDLRLRLKAVTDVDQQPLLVMIPISSTRLSPDRPAQAQATATFNQNPEQIVSILVEHNGAVLMQDNGSGYLAIPQAIQTEDTAQTTAARLLTQAGVSADVGFVYSAYRDIARNQQHIIFLCHAHHAEAPKGVFMDPDQSTLMDIADPVVCSVISRFERESQAGLFGTYVGNERHGDVQASTDSAQQK